MSPNRLTNPFVRKGETLKQSSWNEALDLAAKRLKEIKEKHGPDSIAVLTSAKCTNEENYLLQKFTRAALGTNNIDHCARL
jgi:predicted molibdopterin-dependent oxidoreductase YjgC